MKESTQDFIFGFMIGIVVVTFCVMPLALRLFSVHNRTNFEQEAITNKVAEYRIVDPISGETKFFWITNR